MQNVQPQLPHLLSGDRAVLYREVNLPQAHPRGGLPGHQHRARAHHRQVHRHHARKRKEDLARKRHRP